MTYLAAKLGGGKFESNVYLKLKFIDREHGQGIYGF